MIKNFELLPYSKYEINHTLPVFREFVSSNSSLYYCGVEHTFDPESSLFLRFDQIINDYKPKLMMLEGGTKINPNNPKRQEYFDKISNLSFTECILTRGEYRYGLKKAIEKNIPVFCPEPETVDQIDFLLLKYAREAVFVNQIIEIAVQYFAMESKPLLNEYFEEEISWQKQILGNQNKWLGFDFSYKHFLKLFKTFFEVDFEEIQPEFIIEVNDPIPWPSKIFPWTINNQISQDCVDFRDNFILNQIQKLLCDYDKILVIYGGSHYYAQASALEKIYNKNS